MLPFRRRCKERCAGGKPTREEEERERESEEGKLEEQTLKENKWKEITLEKLLFQFSFF